MKSRKKILIVDGYNIINAWENLKEKGEKHGLDSAREELNSTMSEFASFAGYKVIVVYDAYKVKSFDDRKYKGKNMHIIYTKEKETADTYIEKLISTLGDKRYLDVTVATDDIAEQQIVIGKGGSRISTVQLKIEVENSQKKLQNSIKKTSQTNINSMMDMLQEDVREKLEKMRKKN